MSIERLCVRNAISRGHFTVEQRSFNMSHPRGVRRRERTCDRDIRWRGMSCTAHPNGPPPQLLAALPLVRLVASRASQPLAVVITEARSDCAGVRSQLTTSAVAAQVTVHLGRSDRVNTAAGYPPLADAYRVTAKRWRLGWELYISDAEHGEIGVTNTDETCDEPGHDRANCADADCMARDYLATVHDLSDDEKSELNITIVATDV